MKLFVGQIGSQEAIRNMIKFIMLVLTVSVLTACGGGGGGSTGTIGEDQGSTDGGGTTGGGDGDGVTGVVDNVVRIGNGTGATFVEGEIGVDDLMLDAGASTTLTINFVDSDGDPIDSPQTVTLSSQCVAMGISTLSTDTLTTTNNGFGTVTYTANGCSGEDLVTATVTLPDGTTALATATITVEPDTVLSVEFISASSTSLSLAGVGGNQTTVLTFRLVGAQGANIVGESVTFTTDAQNVGVNSGGARIADGSETDMSGADGTVSTVLQAGTNAGNVRVIATHDATQVSAQSDSIVISSGLPIQRAFSLSQSAVNPARANSLDGVEVDVSVLASDQFGNRISEGTQVNFFAECGTIEASCSIGASGSCTVTWLSNGASQSSADFRCALLAFTEGVETFADVNANSVYEDVDQFDPMNDAEDLPEPFLDANGSGTYDFGERFVDRGVGTENVYDVGNDEWDGLCLIDIVPTANCNGDDTALIFTDGIVVVSGDFVGYTSRGTIANPIAGVVSGTVDLQGQLSGTINITLHDSLLSQNPPGIGTTISIEGGDGYDTAPNADLTVPNTSVPLQISLPYSVNIDPMTGMFAGGDLSLTVEYTVPGIPESSFVIPVTF